MTDDIKSKIDAETKKFKAKFHKFAHEVLLPIFTSERPNL